MRAGAARAGRMGAGAAVAEHPLPPDGDVHERSSLGPSGQLYDGCALLRSRKRDMAHAARHGGER